MPCKPIRGLKKKIGPFDVSLIANAIDKKKGKSTRTRVKEKRNSSPLKIIMLPQTQLDYKN